MKLPTLKELIRHRVVFAKYHDGQLWYEVVTPEAAGYQDRLFLFPVPISDIGNATFLAEDKGILFMRYIRKHLDTLTEAQKETT